MNEGMDKTEDRTVLKVEKTIERENLIEYGDHVLVALSGGYDSVCLVHILYRLKEKYGLKLTAVHLNHRLRGLDSHKDAMYVSKLCESIGIRSFIKAVDVDSYCRENKMSIEEGARKLRYEIFEDLRNKIGANKIAIAHNQNDNVETVLMRIMRGSTISGLAGIAYRRGKHIIRPILDISREEIEKYCDENSLNPVTDKTNLEPIYTRNKIRLELIPYIEENFNDNFKNVMERMRKSFKEDSDYLNWVAATRYAELKLDTNYDYEKLKSSDNTKKVSLEVKKINSLHNSIKSRVIMEALRDVLGNSKGIDSVHISAIMDLTNDGKSGKVLDLPRDLYVWRSSGILNISNKKPNFSNVGFKYEIPLEFFDNNEQLLIYLREIGVSICCKFVDREFFEKNKKKREYKFIDYDKISGRLVFSSRNPGDKIRLKIGTKKVKDIIINMKIPRENRGSLFLLKDDEGIILLDKYRISDLYKIDENTDKILSVQIDDSEGRKAVE